jgi:hypothetical protein
MIELKIKTQVTTRRAHRVEITRKDLVEFMKKLGYDLPRDASIYVNVPGGGDWSNTSLDIDKETPVVVTWATVEESGDGL